MQYFTLIGGFVGFLLTFGVSLLSGKDLAQSVFNATIGCVVMGLLFRGFHAAIGHCAKQVVAEKTRLRDEQLAAEQALNSDPSADPANPPSQPDPETPAPAA
jgi:hypothetical protein